VSQHSIQERIMSLEIAPLPYAKDALEPVLSSKTLEFHYEKHHKGYLTKLNAALQGTPDANKTLEEIVKSSSGAVFNNAAQVWNHTFFWEGLKPGGGGAPPAGDVADLLTRDFGGWDAFKTQFHAAGMGRFGSGWAWLVLEGGKAKIVSTPNAETPLTTSAKPLLTADVWEHAYYLDYQNRRDGFLDAFLDKLINWDFVLKNLKG
jgi:superoxide dismutase, Fe-Mn family